MAPRCKIFVYKKKRYGKPVIQPGASFFRDRPSCFFGDRGGKTQCPTGAKTGWRVVPSCSKSYSTIENYLPYSGEEWYGELEKPAVLLSPQEYLRQWLEKQRFLPKDLSDDFLSFFLTAAAYDVNLATEKLNKYFISRQNPSPLYRDRDPLSVENVNILKKLYVLPMPETTADGTKIIITGAVEPLISYDQMEHAKALAMVFDLLIWEKDFGFGDYIIVFDGRGFQCPQLLENKVHNHRSIKILLQDTIPGTLKSFYLLYPPSYVSKAARIRSGLWMTVIRSKEELISRLPANSLPLEYGGNLGHLGDLLEQWVLHIVQNRDFFVEFEKRMIRAYERRMCYEEAVRSRRKNWVQEMKLVEDEWEYKKKYYEKMKCTLPAKHPAYGSQRLINMKQMARKHAMSSETKPCKLLAKEKRDEKAFQGPPSVVEFPTPGEVQSPQEEEQDNYCIVLPVLELQTFLT